MKIPDEEYKRARLLFDWKHRYDRFVLARTMHSMGLSGMLSAVLVQHVGVLAVIVCNGIILIGSTLWSIHLMKQMKTKSEQIDKM
jgi:hypothetical protein